MLYKDYLEYFKQYISLLFPRYINKLVVEKNQVIIYIPYNFIRQFSLFLRDHSFSLFKVLIEIGGVDYINRKNRFEIVYIFLSLKNYSRVIVKVNLNELDVVSSLTSIYSNSNWYEREVWDMFGIFFSYHNDLRRILTDYGFKGFPLRKDFPLSGYVEVVFDPVLEQVKYVPVKFIQEFRLFSYKSPWGHSISSQKNNSIVPLFLYRDILSNSLNKF